MIVLTRTSKYLAVQNFRHGWQMMNPQNRARQVLWLQENLSEDG